ncbi:MAG: SBBP repeat-containing protein, partial [Acidimicrobiia bacterium]
LDPAGMLPDPVARKTPPVILPEPDAATKARIVEAYGKLPLSFEVNHGQTDGQVKYLARGRGYTLFLTPDEAMLVLSNQSKRTALRMQLVGANPHPKTVASDQLPGKSNYLIGNDPKKWRTNIPTYARVRYQDVYPGVDLVYYGNQRQLEYDLVVGPGADPKSITLAFNGAERLEINDQGDLVLHIAGGKVIQRAPVIYQENNGVKQTINGHYVLRGKDHVAIQVGAYDATTPLVIDPLVLTYSSYLGGSLVELGGTASPPFPIPMVGNAIALDGARNAYITGSTNTDEGQARPFPITPNPGAFDTTFNGVRDVFVTKVNAAGDALVYSTYLGGTDIDEGHGIAVDSGGNAYVTGLTFSVDFPFTAGFFQPALVSGPDAFVAKVNAAGTALDYSTYLGGTDVDGGRGIAVDGEGKAYVTGLTFSGGATPFPTTAGVFQTALASGPDAFVAKVNAAGTALDYSTYLGGTDVDQGQDIALEPACPMNCSAYVTGFTVSNPFPTTVGAFDTTFNGVRDAFVTKLNATGTAPLTYSTYLGGSLIDTANGIFVDAAGSAYVTGSTDSGGATPFPTTVGAFDTLFAGVTDAFVTKVNAAGSALTYSTYLGGSDIDRGNGIALDSVGNVYVTGDTVSADFPTAGSPFQPNLASPVLTDAFATKLNPAGAGAADLVYSTYLGGSDIDQGNDIIVDLLDNAYVTGHTVSTDFPTARFQDTFGGDRDAFISKITESAAAPAPASSADGGSGCFIATAAFGSALAPQVQLLREFRDRYLLPNSVGQAFVSLYYRLSPPLAEQIAGSEIIRAAVRVGLVPVLAWVTLFLWSPTLGLSFPLAAVGLAVWLPLRAVQRRRHTGPENSGQQANDGTRSRRAGLWRRLARSPG